MPAIAKTGMPLVKMNVLSSECCDLGASLPLAHKFLCLGMDYGSHCAQETKRRRKKRSLTCGLHDIVYQSCGDLCGVALGDEMRNCTDEAN